MDPEAGESIFVRLGIFREQEIQNSNKGIPFIHFLLVTERKNREKQCNTDHKETGPGHESGYKGDGTKADRDNHSKQLDPNQTPTKAKKQ